MNLFDLVATLSIDSSGFVKGLSSAKTAVSSLGTGIKKGLATATKVTAVAFKAARTAVVGFGKSAVTAGAQFDTSMSQVAATMGNVDDMDKESFAKLKKSAKDLGVAFDETTTATELSREVLRAFAKKEGSETAFSASQAAEALNYMALAGYDANTSMKMLPNVLNLAAAGSIDLAEASDMVTDAQSALGLNLDETSELVDKMAKASSKTNTSVAQLGEAMLTVGGTAKNLKGGTTELSVALGLLADNGTKGAEGGTALRNIILSLSAPTDSAAKALKALGVEVFDAQGNMRDLKSIFADLDASLSKMSQGEQTQVLSKIFNKVDLKSVNALLGTSADRWDEVTTEINNATGAAQKMAGTQLDNLNGNITIFQSALEGVQIEISDRLTPTLNDFVKMGTQGLSDITAGLKSGGVQGASKALGDFLAEGITVITDKIPVFIEAGSNLIEALLDGINSNMAKIANGATNILTKFVQGLGRNLPKLIKGISTMMVELIKTLSNQIPKIVNGAANILTQILQGLGRNLPKLINGINSMMVELIKALSNQIPKILESLIDSNLIGTLIGTLLEGLTEIIESIAEMVSNPDSMRSIIDSIFTAIDSIIALISNPENLQKILFAVVTIIEQIAFALIDALPQLVDGIMALIDNVVAFVTNPENIAKLIELAAELIVALSTGLLAAAPKLLLGVGEIIKTVIENIVNTDWGALGQQLMESIGEALQNASQKLMVWWDGWSQEIGKYAVIAFNSVVEFWGEFVSTLQSGIGGAVDWLINIWQSAVDGVINAWTPVVNFFVNIVKGIKRAFNVVPNFFKNQFVNAWDNVKKAFSSVGSFFGGIWNTIKSKFTDIGTKVGEAIGGAFKTAINAVIGTVEGAINTIPNAINGAIDLINKLPGVSISKISTVSLPRLAQGGVLKKGQIGFLEGDGDEAVVPLSKNTEWLDKVADKLNSKMIKETAANEKIEISLYIENFNNYSDRDINELTDVLMDRISSRIIRRGAVFA